MYTVVIV